jgi:hypothetical protein
VPRPRSSGSKKILGGGGVPENNLSEKCLLTSRGTLTRTPRVDLLVGVTPEALNGKSKRKVWGGGCKIIYREIILVFELGGGGSGK